MFTEFVCVLETYVDGVPFFLEYVHYWLTCSHCGTACSHFNKADLYIYFLFKQCHSVFVDGALGLKVTSCSI